MINQKLNSKNSIYVIISFGFLAVTLLISFAIRKRIFYAHHYYLNLLIVPFFVSSGFLLYLIGKRIKFRKIHIIMICFFLVLFDQLVKILLLHFTNITYPVFLLSNWLYIDPQFNPWGSYIGDLLGREIPLLGLFELISLPLIYLLYKILYTKMNLNNCWLCIWFVLCISGELCSTIDTLIFGTSYDFITLNGMIKFDIKDYYLKMSKGCFIMLILDWVTQRNQLKSINRNKEPVPQKDKIN